MLEQVETGGFTAADRRRLAAAFRHTATYDVAVASWMGNVLAPDGDGPFPLWVGATWDKAATLRYGENPHQAAALYTSWTGGGVAGAEQLHGKEMSYNNYVDADVAGRARPRRRRDGGDRQAHEPVRDRGRRGRRTGAPAGPRDRPGERVRGVIATNGERGDGRAGRRRVHRGGAGAVVRPGGAGDPHPQEERAAAAPAGRRGARRGRAAAGLGRDAAAAAGRGRRPGDDPATWTLATGDRVDDDVLADLAFAWRACRAVKSNAILLSRGGAAVGIGMGQVNRVDAARLAVARAGDRVRGSVAASDAFFPFSDGLEVLLEAGVRAVVQPGGSVRGNTQRALVRMSRSRASARVATRCARAPRRRPPRSRTPSATSPSTG